MTRLLEMAIEAARQLSDEEQDELARTIMEIVSGDVEQGVHVLSDEERAAVEIARKQVARGEFATEEEIEAIFKNYAPRGRVCRGQRPRT